MLHSLSLGAVLAVLWMLLSGHVEPLMLSFGLGSVLLTVWLARRMDMADQKPQSIPFAFLIRAMAYMPWLIWQIIKSNISVAKIILSPKLSIQSQIFDAKASQHTDLGLVTYANSITLTPGTVTIGTYGDGTLQIHALTDDAREGVQMGDMDRRCLALERRGGTTS